MDIFNIKVGILMLINKAMFGLMKLKACRMYDQRPQDAEANCYLCAMRGGWWCCRRSRSLVLEDEPTISLNSGKTGPPKSNTDDLRGSD